MTTPRKRKNTRPKDTSANRARKDKDPRYQRLGKKNGSYKGGNSAHAYRRKAGAKPGELVHHKDKNKKNSSKKNLIVIRKKGKVSAIGMHNKQHREKGKKSAKVRRSRK